MALAPNGSTLASLGDLHQLPKIELPRNAIGAMGTLLKEDPKLYEDYAIRDAKIATLHMSRLYSILVFKDVNSFNNTS